MFTSNDPRSAADDIARQLETACGEIGWQMARDVSNYGMSFDEFRQELKFNGFTKLATDVGRVREIFRSECMGDILADEMFNNADCMQDMAGDWICDASHGQEDPVTFRNAIVDMLAKRMNHIPQVWENLRE